MQLDLDNLKDLDTEVLESALAAVKAEIDRRIARETIPQQVEDLTQQYEAVVSDLPSREWVDGMVIGPGERVVEDGVEYQNVSGAWLSVPPSAYILGYRSTSVPVTEILDWVPGETFTWEQMEEEGPIYRWWGDGPYRLVQPHTTQVGWEPGAPGMLALWVPATLGEVIGNG